MRHLNSHVVAWRKYWLDTFNNLIEAYEALGVEPTDDMYDADYHARITHMREEGRARRFERCDEHVWAWEHNEVPFKNFYW